MKKLYSITFELQDDGKVTAQESYNDGFTALQVLGLLEMKKLDIARQVWGEIKPSKVKRNCVKEEQP